MYIYYHIAQIGHWREVVLEQMTRLRESGLYDEVVKIHVGVVGNQGRISDLPEKCEIMFHNPILGYGEVPTLEALRQHALKEEFEVLYIHTKGVSWKEQGFDRNALTAWRKYMEYFCVDRWKECLARLGDYNVIGCEYVKERTTSKGPFPGHFRGNFWWSLSGYLRTLPRVINVSMPSTELRRKGEYWIGSGSLFNPFSLFNLDGEQGKRGWLYNHILDPKTYTGESA